MTAKIFSKDLRLAAHPMMYVFALFGVMLIIPNYPYTVVFFYGLLGIFFTFLNGRENKDVYYCAVLPVTKRDQVRARAWLVVAVELAELVIAVPFAFLSARITPTGTNLAVKELYTMIAYVVTIVVLVISSMRDKRENQPPASLGLAYFREER